MAAERMLPGFLPIPPLVRRDGLTLSIEAAIDAYRMIRTEGAVPEAEGQYRALTAEGELIEGWRNALPWHEIVAVELIDSRLDLCPCCAEWPVRITFYLDKGKTIVSAPHCERCKGKTPCHV